MYVLGFIRVTTAFVLCLILNDFNFSVLKAKG